MMIEACVWLYPMFPRESAQVACPCIPRWPEAAAPRWKSFGLPTPAAHACMQAPAALLQAVGGRPGPAAGGGQALGARHVATLSMLTSILS